MGEIIPKHEIYDYECKYTPGMAMEEFPAKLSREATTAGSAAGAGGISALKLRGYARIDFRLTTEGRVLLSRGKHVARDDRDSLIPQGAAAMGIGFPELCERIVRLALG